MTSQQSSSNNNNNNIQQQEQATKMNTSNTCNKQKLDSILKNNTKYTTTTTTLATPPTNTNTTIVNTMNYTAIADTAATGNYITEKCPVSNKRPSAHGVDVIIPNGSSMTSTHTALLQLPSELLLGARKAHIFPALKLGSLISIGQLCDHDCTALFC